MILRRVTEHVKAQNWFAVGVDLVIVVVGVFIGIQVANWNEERTQKLRERSYLAQLCEEIGRNDESIEHQLRFVGQVISSGRRALDYLQSGADCATGCEALVVDFFHASQLWGTPFARAKYEETQRLGFPSDPRARAAVDDYYAQLNGWQAVIGAAPPYRERIRGHFTAEAADALWRACWRAISGGVEELPRDCEADLERLGAPAMLRDIRNDAGMGADLRFWIGQNIFAAQVLPAARDRARAANAAITDDLHGGP
jgi:hypothetical protein